MKETKKSLYGSAFQYAKELGLPPAVAHELAADFYEAVEEKVEEAFHNKGGEKLLASATSFAASDGPRMKVEFYKGIYGDQWDWKKWNPS
jgi:hypothetical protein